MGGCDAVSVPPRSYCNATEPSMWPRTKGMSWSIICISLFPENSVFLVNTNLWSFSLLFTHWPKQITHYISLSDYVVLCTWFALISLCSHSTVIVQALCKPWKAFLHYSHFQQMFIFTTLLTLLAFLPSCKQFVPCSDYEVYFGKYFSEDFVWVRAY